MSIDEWEQEYQSGGQGSPVDMWESEFQSSQPTLGSESSAVAGNFLRGASDLVGGVGTLASYLQMGMTGQHPANQNPNLLEVVGQAGNQLADAGYGQEPARSDIGKILANVAYVAPSRLIPGVGTLSTLTSGVGRGVVDIGGGSELEKAGGEIIGGSLPSLAGAVLKKGGNVVANQISRAKDLPEEAGIISRLWNSISGNATDIAEVQTRDILQKSGINTDDAVRALSGYSDEGLDAYKTTAEVINQPSTSTIEEMVRLDPNNPLAVKGQFTANEVARDAARNDLVRTIIPDEIADYALGDTARKALEQGKEAYRGVLDELSPMIKGGKIKTLDAKRAGFDAASRYQQNINLTGIREKYGSAFGDIFEDFTSLPKDAPIETLQDFNRKFGELITPEYLATSENKQVNNIAGAIRKQIEGSIDDALAKGNLPKETADAWKQMRSTRKEMGRQFEMGGTGRVLQKDKFKTGYEVSAENVFKPMLSDLDEAARTRDALKFSDSGKLAVQQKILQDAWKKSFNTETGTLKKQTFVNEVKSNAARNKILLNDDQLKVFDIIAEDAASQLTYKDKALKASAGRSPTGEINSGIELIKNAITGGLKGKVSLALQNVFGGALSKAIDIIPINRKEALVREILVEFAQNPKYAKQILEKPDLIKVNTLKELAKVANQVVKRTAIAGVREGEDWGSEVEGLLKSDDSEPIVTRSLEVTPSDGYAPTSNTNNSYEFMDTLFKGDMKKQKPAEVIEQIKKDPIDHAIMLMESNGDPNAKNPTSSASGLFQLIKKTAGNLGVKDVFDPVQNYKGYLKLKADTIKKFGRSDVATIYASHYLGEGTLRKMLEGKPLTKTQQEQVNYLKTKLLPKLTKIYSKLVNEQMAKDDEALKA